jgi:hypothetical protein
LLLTDYQLIANNTHNFLYISVNPYHFMRYELYDRNDFAGNVAAAPAPQPFTDFMLRLIGARSTSASPESIRTEVLRLLSKGKTGDAINCAIKHTKKYGDKETLTPLYLLLGRWHDLNSEHSNGTLSAQEEMIQHNQIVASLLENIV